LTRPLLRDRLETRSLRRHSYRGRAKTTPVAARWGRPIGHGKAREAGPRTHIAAACATAATAMCTIAALPRTAL